MLRNRPDLRAVVRFNGATLNLRAPPARLEPSRPADRRVLTSRRRVLLGGIGAAAALAVAACGDDSAQTDGLTPIVVTAAPKPAATARPNVSPAPEQTIQAVPTAMPTTVATAPPEPPTTRTPVVSAALRSQRFRPSRRRRPQQPRWLRSLPIPKPPFDDADVAVLLEGLLERRNMSRTSAIVDAVVASGDERFLAVLIEFIRFNEFAVISGPGVPGVLDALKAMTGHVFIYTSEWAKWYGAVRPASAAGIHSVEGATAGSHRPAHDRVLPR